MPVNHMRSEDWPPSLADVSHEWSKLILDFWQTQVGQALSPKIAASLADGKLVYPRSPFRGLTLTPFEKVRVLILGQDPYHGACQADGLAFSVGSGQKIPPSLRNIFKEVQRDTGIAIPVGPAAGSLERWSEQGVLLLNTAFTVEDSKPASHSDWGWEVLTDKIIQTLAAQAKPCAFLLWGAHAQAKVKHIEAFNGNGRHLILKANHPSPLSALRPPLPFLGCGHFGFVNQWLMALDQKPIAW